MERPVDRYLYKYDPHFDRIVPDWNLQYKTVEQQFLYKGDFAVFIREVTKEGAIVQDVVTSIFGFVPKSAFGTAEIIPGAVVHGARCTYMDNTVISSEIVEVIRWQTGIVFEWDEQKGQGYILPTEEQQAFKMLRVLRRDINWHGAKRLTVGQFVQFETVFPDEVPITRNDERDARFALRVRAPEVKFSFATTYQAKPLTFGEGDRSDPEDRGWTSLQPYQKLDGSRPGVSKPVSGRPTRTMKTRVHPLLERFVDEAPVVARAESPAWLWEAPIEYRYEDIDEPIVPLGVRQKPKKEPDTRIFTHETAMERGDLWREPALFAQIKENYRIKPPGRRQQERDTVWADAVFRKQMKREKLAAKERVGYLQGMK